MTRLKGLFPAIRCRLCVRQTARRHFAIAWLLALCALLFGSALVGAQEERRDDGSREMLLDLSDRDAPDDESPAGRRLILEIPLPSQNEDEQRQEGEEPTGAPRPAAESEGELWQVVRGLQQDLEMLKEEIAQLRSEFRSLMPEDSGNEAVAKQTVNPFWITDAQLERLEQR